MTTTTWLSNKGEWTMALSRRNFIKFGTQFGVAASASMLWTHRASAEALSQFGPSDYKAVVLITMPGGNDCNNTLLSMDSAIHSAYTALRPSIALGLGALHPIMDSSSSAQYGLHPSLVNIADLHNKKKALVIANVGSLPKPSTKAQVLQNPSLYPGMSFSHPVGVQQWESAQASAIVSTGWGGRIADYVASESGRLPPVLSAGGNATFTVGKSVQAVALQSGSAFAAIPPALNSVIGHMAATNKVAQDELVQQHAALRVQAMASQSILDQAASYVTVKTSFPTSAFGAGMQKIAQILAGRSIIGASRQVFYIQQGGYDTHANQLTSQATQLADLDAGIGALFVALDELGLSDQVIVCTHSDFGRSMQANSNGGTDHAWGGHHFILGGGVSGGRVIGSLPEMEYGGPTDCIGTGVWIPGQSVTQMTAGLGSWMGLNTNQLNDVFVDLKNFPNGAVQL
jgi:uncharacterized protein (DUF1501 family)